MKQYSGNSDLVSRIILCLRDQRKKDEEFVKYYPSLRNSLIKISKSETLKIFNEGYEKARSEIEYDIKKELYAELNKAIKQVLAKG